MFGPQQSLHKKDDEKFTLCWWVIIAFPKDLMSLGVGPSGEREDGRSNNCKKKGGEEIVKSKKESERSVQWNSGNEPFFSFQYWRLKLNSGSCALSVELHAQSFFF